MRKIIGRKSEITTLLNAIKSDRPELIVVYGRRRVGKTFLIRQCLKSYIQFEFTGLHNGSLTDQLKNFRQVINEYGKKFKKPSSWLEAFNQLRTFIDGLRSKEKKVIFIDEFPWLATNKSKFLMAFENFWNSYASQKDDLMVVICGSAASYMINNIIKNKGGLHNRMTHKIQLTPFNLYETELLLKQKGAKLTRYDILQIYMTMGGIPHYLEKIEAGNSSAQFIDTLCFSKNGFLRTEFKNVFASLFEQHDTHETIVRALASVRRGLTRTAIIKKCKLKPGGTLSKVLVELEESGFIEKYLPMKGIKNALYRLVDEYSLFYIQYIEKNKPANHFWVKMHGLQTYKIWSGYSFESICIKHIEQIKKELGISGIRTVYGSWIEKGASGNAQIDLLIDRDDHVINICEIKFSNTEFTINKKYAGEIAKKVQTFISSTKTKKSILVTFITTYGLLTNQYKKQYVQNELTLDDLFVDV
ncbi:MAG: hypothetical protein A3G23_00150 [Bacteroidetes bacterium RIFCSPLOWO2_12_FULL_37_12]|nr:MAG: hypothetical protein A3G23_00150 [Bacteroidetes bacterium RIFCSPLOWO2_12_FULL_37_12]